MAGQLRPKPTRAALAPPKRDSSATMIPPKKLFASCESVEQRQDAIVAALHRLAVLVNAEADTERKVAMAELLCDMQPRALQLAFEHLERTHNIAALPAPAEIRECGLELWRKEQQSAREGETLREMQELEQRRREHPEEFVPFGEVVQMLRDKCKTAPDPQRTTPQEEAVTGEKAQREAQAKKVALHKAAKP